MYEIFLKQSDEKKERIINACMREFSYGFKKASTDVIVKEAKISKGTLFNYFKTKEDLYKYILKYTTEVVYLEYFDMLEFYPDFLECIWQAALLKQDISTKHPYIYNFLSSLVWHKEDFKGLEVDEIIKKWESETLEKLYEKTDLSLFRDDIDPRKTVFLIWNSLDFLFTYEEDCTYEQFLGNIKSYLDIYRKCFYKEKK